MNSLQQALKGDKMHPKVQDITVLNLVEITRKKSRQNLSSVLYTPCPVCNGRDVCKAEKIFPWKLSVAAYFAEASQQFEKSFDYR